MKLILCALGLGIGIPMFAYGGQSAEERLVRIGKIRFEGNQKFSTGRLKAFILTKEGGWIDTASVADGPAGKPFDRDVQRLNHLYFTQGFVQAKIAEPQILFAPDRKSVSLTFSINEGERYKVGKVDFVGKLPVAARDLLAAVKIQRQSHFNYEALQDDLKILESKCGETCNLIPRTRIRDAEREVDVTFEFTGKGA